MILGILQARVSSSRLPGKVLKEIIGKPMITRQVERLKRSKLIDTLLIATSKDPSDDKLESLCKENNIPCFRGQLDDVLDRFYQAARLHSPEHIVRLTGDCPLLDPEVVDKVIELHLNGGYDYTSNTMERTFPDGLDVEVCRFSCIEAAWREAKLPSQREHVTPFLYQQPNRFSIGSFRDSVDLSNLRWTVDEPEDFELVYTIYNALYPENPWFSTTDILAYLDKKPELKTMNAHYKLNEGLQKSLAEDIKYYRGNNKK